ncbi:alkaline phosphatase [Planctomycetales bacterium]|nr:alkaline phosphatase [Planctomycetales bacterium]
MKSTYCERLTRRAFLVQGTLVVSGAFAIAEVQSSALKIGLFTDIHYDEKEHHGNRYFRESPAKLAAAAEDFEKHQIDFLVELGDLIDSSESPEADKKYLQTINDSLKRISKRRYYVIGNHCVATLTKDEFLSEIGQEKSYFSFDSHGYHFVVLDACFGQDGIPYGRGSNKDWKDTKIPDAELDWLKSDLAETHLPGVVFLHHRLDMENDEAHTVKNADKVRAVLEKSKKVRLVLQGHDHRGGYKEIEGISYCTLSAVIEGSGLENNSFSVLELTEQGDIRLHGFCKQKSRTIISGDIK